MKKKCCVLLGAALFFGAAGCSGGFTDEQKANSLIIEVFGGGYGTDMIYALANKYSQKTGKQVLISVQTGSQGVTNMSTNLRSYAADTDIFFTKGTLFSDIYKGEVSIGGTTYECLFEDLTDLYNTKLGGEDVLYKDKMLDNYEEYYNMQPDSETGKYYFTAWASGAVGFVVNMDVWKDSWGVPRTTNELFETCDKIKTESSAAPFIYSGGDEYWTMLSQLWMAQYEGKAQMNKFYAGYDYDGKRYSDNMAAYDGYLETLKFYDRLLKKENGYMHSASKDADFTNMQGLFLQGKAAITPNGDWIEGEMKYNYPDANIKMIKTPVISALADKCSFAGNANADELLRSLVDYADGVISERPAGCTEEDAEIVREARKVELAGAGPDHIALIPCYSNQKESAKDFLLYMASEEGRAIYRENTGGCELPFVSSGDTQNKYSSFRESVRDLLNRSSLCVVSSKDKIYSIGGISVYLYNNAYGRFVTRFSADSAKDYVSPLDYYSAEMEVIKKLLPSAKQRIGL